MILPSSPPAITARAAVVMDGDTGQVLFERNAHLRLPQASTTKMMTALVAAEQGSLSSVLSISTRSARVGGSSLYLEPGERLTLAQLLYGLLLVSGNDAACAIAEGLAGADAGFVARMNARAQSLHLADTHFANPHGLPDPNHYSSAFDLAVIARAALANPVVAKISDTKTMVLPGNRRIARRTLINHNKLLGHFPGASGGKTGYTTVAGRCFVGSAHRNGRYVIEAILDSPRLWEDAAKLLDYGLDDFKSVPAAPASATFGTVKVSNGEVDTVPAMLSGPARVALPNSDSGAGLSHFASLSQEISAPVVAGSTLGWLQIKKGNQVLTSYPLVAARGVEKGPPIGERLLQAAMWFFFGSLLSLGGLNLRKLWRRVRKANRRNRRQRARKLPGAQSLMEIGNA